MQFSGNYFIHGIPYYEDGERVSTQYSGGCIRLTDKDAEGVYDFSDKNTYVVVLKKDDLASDNTAESYDNNIMNNIKISYKDKRYLILDIKDNIYFSNISKLNQSLLDTGIENIAITMTALDNVSQEKMIYIGEEKIKQLDILPQLLAGDKEATNRTIEPLGWRLFQAFLESKIKSIGLENTEIDTDTSTSTLLDMMYIYRYAYIYKPYLMSLDNKENTDKNIIWQTQSGKYNIKIIKDSSKDFLIIYY